jgi:hypothetical protein
MQTFHRWRALTSAFFLAGMLVLLGEAWGRAADASNKSAAPPAGAIALFDGKDFSGWTSRNGKPAQWKVENGYMEVVPGKGDIMTKEKSGPDFQLHVEFWLPLMAEATGQARANSGIYLQGRYELQVLDSYMNKTYADGACGALYGLIAPNWAVAEAKGQSEPKNPCKPPEQWQTYDITFHAPRVDSEGKVTEKGDITVVQNGVTVIDHGAFRTVTAGAINNRIGEPGPLRLQDHNCKVRYRNIWLKPLATK